MEFTNNLFGFGSYILGSNSGALTIKDLNGENNTINLSSTYPENKDMPLFDFIYSTNNFTNADINLYLIKSSDHNDYYKLPTNIQDYVILSANSLALSTSQTSNGYVYSYGFYLPSNITVYKIFIVNIKLNAVIGVINFGNTPISGNENDYIEIRYEAALDHMLDGTGKGFTNNIFKLIDFTTISNFTGKKMNGDNTTTFAPFTLKLGKHDLGNVPSWHDHPTDYNTYINNIYPDSLYSVISRIIKFEGTKLTFLQSIKLLEDIEPRPLYSVVGVDANNVSYYLQEFRATEPLLKNKILTFEVTFNPKASLRIMKPVEPAIPVDSTFSAR